MKVLVVKLSQSRSKVKMKSRTVESQISMKECLFDISTSYIIEVFTRRKRFPISLHFWRGQKPAENCSEIQLNEDEKMPHSHTLLWFHE
jgi:hypothetical protein